MESIRRHGSTMTPRCIVLSGDGRRCPRPAARAMEDLYACTRHDGLQVAIMSDMLAPQTRRMLAYARWETYDEGRGLINRMHARRAAA